MARRSIAARADVHRVCKAGLRLSFNDHTAAAETAEAIAKQRTKENKVNNCGTCRHWGSVRRFRFREDPNSEIVRKRCGRIVDASDVGKEELINISAYTEDGEDYYSGLMTKPDFGCVLWEPKQ